MKRTLLERFMDKLREEPNTGCWLWKGHVDSSGYGYMFLGGHRKAAHRLSWILQRGEIPDGYYVCHKCDIRNCVNPCHLFLGTPSDNARDKVEKNRHYFGERHHGAKLTSSQVYRIKELLAAGTPQAKIAAAFGVCRATVGNISCGKVWKHVEGPDTVTSAEVAKSFQNLPGANNGNQEPILSSNTVNTGGKMSTFPAAFEFVMNHEDPQRSGKVTEDAGGRTRFGIAQKFHPELTPEFFSGPAEEALKQAKEILRRDYWDRMRLSDVSNQNVANKLFDMAVNMGVHQAGVYAQRAANGLISAQVALPSAVEQRSLSAAATANSGDSRNAASADPYADLRPLVPMFRLEEDGVLGDKSLAAINSFDPIAYYQLLCDLSQQHYVHVASINPAQSANLQGWLKRAAA